MQDFKQSEFSNQFNSSQKVDIFVCLLLNFLDSTLTMLTPIIIEIIINYISKENRTDQQGWVLVVGVVLYRIIMCFIRNHENYQFAKLGYNLQNVVTSMIYVKSMKVSLLSNKQHKTGELVNLVQVDSSRFQGLLGSLTSVVFLPIQLGFGLWLMFTQVGMSSFAGLGVIVLMMGVNFTIGKYQFRFQKAFMDAKDKRLKTTNQVFSSIKFIQVNAWEEHFYEKLEDKRETELSILRKRLTLGSLSIFSLHTTPMFILNAIFGVYTLTKQVLTPSQAFTVISIFSILQDPLRMVPSLITSLIETNIAIGRIQKFLLTTQIDVKCIQHNYDNKNSNIAIEITNGNFNWGDDFAEAEEKRKLKKEEEQNPKKTNQKTDKQISPQQQGINYSNTDSIMSQDDKNKSLLGSESASVDLETSKLNKKPREVLQNIRLSIKRGSIVAIVGDVGSGQTSLFSSLIGQMIYEKENNFPAPRIKINGDLVLVAQKPWIFNSTVQNNILYGQPKDEARYQDAIQFSCLASDLKILPNADQTEIGQKGVNLSGGQKARISLARALYSNADILLLDDILSAVDVHVAQSILLDCLKEYKKDTTRVLVTHALNFIKYVDYIYVMDSGQIVEEGTYEKIRASERFRAIYTQFMKNQYSQKDDSAADAQQKIDSKNPVTKQTEQVKGDDDNLNKEEGADDDDQKQKKLNSDEKLLTIDTEEQLKVMLQQSTDDSKNSSSDQNNQSTLQSSMLIQGKETKEEDPELKQELEVYEQLIVDEDRQYGELSFSVYQEYFRMGGGALFVISVFVLQTLFQGLKMGSNIWMSKWTDHLDEGRNTFYLVWFSVFSISYGVCALFRALVTLFSSYRAAQKLHKMMISCLLFAPILEFFERVPLGRILNRLSQDLNVVVGIYKSFQFLIIQKFITKDTEIGYAFGGATLTLFNLIGATIMCVYATSYIVIIPICIFLFFSFFLQQYVMKAMREVYRLEGISQSPVLSYLTQCLNGLPTIRAYRKTETSIARQCYLIDENKQCQLAMNSINIWFMLRLSMMSMIVNFSALYICVRKNQFIKTKIFFNNKKAIPSLRPFISWSSTHILVLPR